MNASFKVNPTLTIDVEASDQKELFENLGQLQEIFSQTQCGACKSDNVRYVVREVVKGKKTFKYYELHCQKCRARLAFGQHNDKTTLFPKRKDEDGKWIPNNGWAKWEGHKE